MTKQDKSKGPVAEQETITQDDAEQTPKGKKIMLSDGTHFYDNRTLHSERRHSYYGD